MARRRQKKRDELEETGEGMVSRAGGIARDNPVAAGGAIVMALTGCLIVANAIGFQPGRHPAPLFSTRDRAAEAAAADPDAWRSVQAPKVSALVLDLQQELRRVGLYAGPLDGILGPATEQSIRHFERFIGVPETGQPTDALLAQVTLQGPVPEERSLPIPRPKPGPAVRGTQSFQPRTDPDITASIPANAPPVNVPNPSPSLSPKEARLAKIQGILSELGYGPLVADGVMGENTSAAIRRFELDRGLPLTGMPSGKVIERLEMVSGETIDS